MVRAAANDDGDDDDADLYDETEGVLFSKAAQRRNVRVRLEIRRIERRAPDLAPCCCDV